MELQLPLGDVPIVVIVPPDEEEIEIGQSFEDVPLFTAESDPGTNQ